MEYQNGVAEIPAYETCTQRCVRVTGNVDADYWKQCLLICTVPPDAPAEEWEDGIYRVLAFAGVDMTR
jgi:hypothetical protein